ncbi:MAG: efflux RND transporter permease subunit [Bryobacteraceae bacterium]
MQKLAELCIKRPVFATMLILALVVMGINSYTKLGVDFFPKVDFPIVTITTTLRGAAPEEIETQVSKRIEETVNTIAGIDDLRSVSSEGVSQVFIQFVLEKDPEVAAQEVRDKISRVLRDLPRDADPPIVEKLATDASPIINVVVASGRDLRETTKVVDDTIKKNIESLSGVGQVKFVGDRTRQIQIWLDGEKLYSYNLNIDQVRAAVAAQNVEIPGGRVEQGSRELSLRTLGRVENPKDFARIVVGAAGGNPVRISDIGYVEDGVEEPRSLARLDGTPAVVLEVRKQAGTNTLNVIHAIKDRIAELKTSMPKDYVITYTRDQSDFISDSFNAVQEHLILGGIFAAGIVFLFIRSWRSTLIAAIAIPTSIISTYTLMNAMGFTLDQITMLALVLMVGIVIDDAIVVLENIFRFAEEKGLSPMEAAIQGTRDIGLAVLSTTLSLVIIFIPVALMSGIVGKFMSSFGYTAAFAIMVSMLVSFTLTPMLCARFLKPEVKKAGHTTKEAGFFRHISRPYQAMLGWSMSHRWVIVCISALVVASIVPLFKMTGVGFLPTDDQGEFEVIVRLPPGSSLSGSETVMKELEAELKQLPGIRNILTTIGADVRQQVDRGSIIVELNPLKERKQSQKELMVMARERMKKFRELTIAVQLPALIQGGGSNAELQFFVQGPDLKQLEKYAGEIKRRLANVQGVADLDSSYEAGKPELRVKVNRDKAADLNVSVSSIANALRTLVGGDDQVTTYREGEDRYDVQLRVQKEFRNSPQALDRLYVPSGTLGNVSVASVASLEPADGPTQIERYNRQRQILLTANLVGGQSLSKVLPVLDETIASLNMPSEYRTGLVGQSKEFGRAAKGYVIAFILSIVFMYMVLAAQFESFIDPVTILLSLPLSIPFALLSLVLAHENFSVIYTSLGILVLFGIVKKNSILQIDHIKKLRAGGADRLHAIMQGCEDRLRPILMTTAALVAGMIPLALGGGAGSGSRRTVAIVVIGGQSLCLLLTLLVTPVAYSLFDDVAHFNLWGRLRGLFRGRKVQMVTTTLPLLLVLLAASVGPAWSQAPPPRVGLGGQQHKLSLQEAIELALANNLEIEIEKTNRDTAQEAVRSARGFFDPAFRWVPLFENRNTPTGSILQGSSGTLNERFLNQNFYLDQRLPNYGTALNLTFENARQTNTNPFSSFNPFFTSRLALGLNQPLLRGLHTDPARTEINIRRKRLDLSGVDYEIRVIDVVTRVEQAYWDLVASRQDVVVEGDSVSLAREQLAVNRRLIDSGTLAPVELAASEAELQRRLDTLYSSLATLTAVENTLKTLLTPDRKAPIWAEEIVPADDQTSQIPETEDLGQAVAQALKRRPELRSVTLQQEANDIQKDLNSDLRKPQVNIVANYSLNGLGGSIRPGENPFTASSNLLYSQVNRLSTLAGIAPLPIVPAGTLPDFLIGGYGTALGNVFGGRYQSIQAGLQIDLNLRNRTADANYVQSLIAEKRLRLQQAQVEQGVEAQVRNALQGVQSGRQRIAAAEASARAAQEKLESEARLFQTGESTNFLVLTRQNEAADSRRRAVIARLDFNKSLSRLQQVTGSTLSSHKITIH